MVVGVGGMSWGVGAGQGKVFWSKWCLSLSLGSLKRRLNRRTVQAQGTESLRLRKRTTGHLGAGTLVCGSWGWGRSIGPLFFLELQLEPSSTGKHLAESFPKCCQHLKFIPLPDCSDHDMIAGGGHSSCTSHAKQPQWHSFFLSQP